MGHGNRARVIKLRVNYQNARTGVVCSAYVAGEMEADLILATFILRDFAEIDGHFGQENRKQAFQFKREILLGITTERNRIKAVNKFVKELGFGYTLEIIPMSTPTLEDLTDLAASTKEIHGL